MRYSLDVRYSECDMQQVVHNSVYLRWCDDLADTFFRDLAVGLESGSWDIMVKAASITWSAPARLRDTVDIDIQISRFGNTSFDVTYVGTVGGEPVFEATMVYVCVVPGTLETAPVPQELRDAVAGDG
ncbi:MAG TPA: thioesterase family protein [Acidimicrobiales bacterium]|nr:thioesterase family protein [Acidimicrobiales bacterium]